MKIPGPRSHPVCRQPRKRRKRCHLEVFKQIRGLRSYGGGGGTRLGMPFVQIQLAASTGPTPFIHQGISLRRSPTKCADMEIYGSIHLLQRRGRPIQSLRRPAGRDVRRGRHGPGRWSVEGSRGAGGVPNVKGSGSFRRATQQNDDICGRVDAGDASPPRTAWRQLRTAATPPRFFTADGIVAQSTLLLIGFGRSGRGTLDLSAPINAPGPWATPLECHGPCWCRLIVPLWCGILARRSSRADVIASPATSSGSFDQMMTLMTAALELPSRCCSDDRHRVLPDSS
jgi:hypothetical protein